MKAGDRLDPFDVSLLQVCFLPADQAATVWDRDVAARLVIDDLAHGAQDLLPRLHRRLVEIGREPASLERMRGVRRRTWVRNEGRLRAARGAVAAIEDAGLPVVVFGGAAVIGAEPGSVELRALHHIEIQVAAGDAVRAEAALAGAGWQRGARWRDGALLDVVDTTFTDPDGTIVELRSSSSAGFGEVVARARSAELGAIPWPVAGAADLLVSTILDGERAAMPQSPRWVADGLALLLADLDAVDWTLVVAAATARGRTGSVLAALRVVTSVVPDAVPSGVLRELEGASTERWIDRFDAHPAARPGVAVAHLRRVAGRGPVAAVSELPAYLCEVWDLAGPGHLPGALVGRLAGQVRRH